MIGAMDCTLLSKNFDDLKKNIASKYLSSINFPKVPDQFKNHIQYHLNDLGFRDTEISKNVDVCYYGCSITFGVGVAEKYRWTNILDKQNNFTSNNFGISGASIEDIAHLFITTSDIVKTKKAIFLLPDCLRGTFPILNNNQKEYVNASVHYPYYYQNNTEYYKACAAFYTLPDIFHLENALNNILLIQKWAKMKQIQILFCTWAADIHSMLNNIIKVDYLNYLMELDRQGCDGNHPGINAHKNLADRINEVITCDVQSTIQI